MIFLTSLVRELECFLSLRNTSENHRSAMPNLNTYGAVTEQITTMSNLETYGAVTEQVTDMSNLNTYGAITERFVRLQSYTKS